MYQLWYSIFFKKIEFSYINIKLLNNLHIRTFDFTMANYEDVDINFVFMSEVNNGILPSKGSDLAAGYDLVYNYDNEIVIKPMETRLVKTGLRMEIKYNDEFPAGVGIYLRVAPRSGLALKGIMINAGVIDEDYRGEIGVVMVNLGATDFVVTPKMKIAQFIPELFLTANVNQVSALGQTSRGEGGFGSTGTHAN